MAHLGTVASSDYPGERNSSRRTGWTSIVILTVVVLASIGFLWIIGKADVLGIIVGVSAGSALISKISRKVRKK